MATKQLINLTIKAVPVTFYVSKLGIEFNGVTCQWHNFNPHCKFLTRMIIGSPGVDVSLLINELNQIKASFMR